MYTVAAAEDNPLKNASSPKLKISTAPGSSGIADEGEPAIGATADACAAKDVGPTPRNTVVVPEFTTRYWPDCEVAEGAWTPTGAGVVATTAMVGP